MDNRPSSQDEYPIPSETDGRTLADYRPVQAPTGRQTRIRQDELLVDVQEAEEGHGSLWDREIHKLSLWTALIRNIGTFKGNAHRECKPSIGTHEHRYDTDLRQNNEPKTQQRPDDAGRQAQCFIQGHQDSIMVDAQKLQSRKTND